MLGFMEKDNPFAIAQSFGLLDNQHEFDNGPAGSYRDTLISSNPFDAASYRNPFDMAYQGPNEQGFNASSQFGDWDTIVGSPDESFDSSAFGQDLGQFDIHYDSNEIERTHGGVDYFSDNFDPYALEYGVLPGGGPEIDYYDTFNPEDYAGRLVQDNFAGTNVTDKDKSWLGKMIGNAVNTSSPSTAEAAAKAKRRQQGYSDTFMATPYSTLYEGDGFKKPFGYFDENPNIVDGQPTNLYDGGNMATFNDRYTGGAGKWSHTKSDAARYQRFYDSLGNTGMGNDLMNRELESRRADLGEIQGVMSEINSGMISSSMAQDPNDPYGDQVPVTIRGGKILSYEHIDDFTARMQGLEKIAEADVRSITNQSRGDPIAFAGQIGPHETARGFSATAGKVLDKAGDVLFRAPGWVASQALDKTGKVLNKIPFVGDTLGGLLTGGGDAVMNLGSNLDHTLGGLPQTFIDRPSQMIRGGMQALGGNPAGMLNMKNAGGNFLNETLGRGLDLGLSAVDLVKKPLVESGLNLSMGASGGVRPGGGGTSGKKKSSPSGKPEIGRGSLGPSKPITPGSGMVKDGSGNSHNLNTAEGQLSYQSAMGPTALKGALAASGIRPKISIGSEGDLGSSRESSDLFALSDSDKSTVYEDVGNTGKAGEMSTAKAEALEQTNTQKLYEELGFPELANA